MKELPKKKEREKESSLGLVPFIDQKAAIEIKSVYFSLTKSVKDLAKLLNLTENRKTKTQLSEYLIRTSHSFE